jgi:phage RecT family recombinase
MSMPQNGAAQPKADPRDRFMNLIRALAKEFAATAPISVPQAEMQRAMDRTILAFRAQANRNPDIFECTPESVARGVAMSSLTGLMPGGPLPDVDLIPRKTRVKEGGSWRDGPKELQWQISWRGYVTLAKRAGCLVKPINVYVGDAFEWEEGLDSNLTHRPALGGVRMITEVDAMDPLVASYVVVTYPDGRRDFVVMDRAAIVKRRDRSDGWRQFKDGRIKSTPWAEWPDEQALKTVVRYGAQRGVILLDDVARYAFEADGAEDAPRPEVIDATATPMRAPAPAPRAIADTLGGLDSLADELEREPVPLRETIDEVVEQAAPSAATKKPPAKGKPAAQLTAEQVQLIAAVKAAEDLLAEDKAADVRMSVDVKYNAAVEDLTVDQLRRLADALGVGFGS